MKQSANRMRWRQFIRQQWRMWIETAIRYSNTCPPVEFIRQQWRMWIETQTLPCIPFWLSLNSFASNGECGLKRSWWTVEGEAKPTLNSFASNGECGLKRQAPRFRGSTWWQFIRQQWRMWIETPPPHNFCRNPSRIHSPAMANVD